MWTISKKQNFLNIDGGNARRAYVHNLSGNGLVWIFFLHINFLVQEVLTSKKQ